METGREFEYCLVGNIVEKRYFGVNKEIRSGTKHFRGGAKVFILPQFGGGGNENTRVIGIPRKRYSTIDIVIPTKLITNVRVKKIFHPELKKKIEENSYYSWWKREGENEINSIMEFAEFINQYSKENNRYCISRENDPDDLNKEDVDAQPLTSGLAQTGV